MENIKQIKKIDVHAHATAFPEYFPPFRAGTRLVSAEEVIGMYDRLGIEKGLLLPITSPEGQYAPMTTEACMWLVDTYPDRFIPACNVDPRAIFNDPVSPLYDLLAFYKEHGVKAMGELTANIYTDDPRMETLLGACAELDLPVTIHMAPHFKEYGIVDELGLPRLEKMLKKFPNLTVLGHSRCFWSEISGDNNEETRDTIPSGKVTDGRIAQLMREYPGLYCDISAGSGSNAFMRDPEYAARFIEEFSDRILYGCDICAAHNTFPFAFAEFLDKMLDDGMISSENYRKIVRDNAIKVLKLND